MATGKSANNEIIEQVQKDVKVALKNEKVPKIYSNGFITGTSLSDAFIMLQANGETMAFVNMSFTSIKSLHENLSNLISDFEAQNNHSIMIMKDIKQSKESN